ncbi:MAG TPA: DedA family protein [Terriglobales bacterium]|nr:DedA family protein [Terriglobales bacterium]
MSISLIRGMGRGRAGDRRIDSRPLVGRSTGRAPQTRRIGLGYPARVPGAHRRGSVQPPSLEARVLSFIDQIVIPFLTSLYGTVGYLGVFFAMFIESTLLPLPSELILPFAGYMVSDATNIEPLTHGPWLFWIVVVVGTAANTAGSLFGYFLGARLGRPFLDRWGKHLLIRKHEVHQAEQFFARWGSPTAFFSRLLPGVRSVISFIAGVSHMPIGRFTVYSTLGAIPWTIALVYAGTVLGGNWKRIRADLQPFDTLIVLLCVAAVGLFVWWRLGHPGWRRGGQIEG